MDNRTEISMQIIKNIYILANTVFKFIVNTEYKCNVH